MMVRGNGAMKKIQMFIMATGMRLGHFLCRLHP